MAKDTLKEPGSETPATQPDNILYINSIIRAVELLSIFNENERELGITEISKKMNLHKSSVYRIVKTLESVGWLDQNTSNSKYRLGMCILDVSSVILNNYDYRDVINSEMHKLMQETGETVILSVYTNIGGVCVDIVEANSYIIYTSKLGQKTPVYSGATGKILLAYQSDAEIQSVIEMGLKPYTPYTITDPDDLREELNKIRVNGYAISMEETDPGVGAVGVPVFSNRGNMVYSLSIVAPVDRMRKKGVRYLIEKAQSTSQEITRHIGNAL